MGRHAEHAGEETEEMKRARARRARCALQIHCLVRVGVEPQRGFHRAAAGPRAERRRLARRAGGDFSEAGREQQSDFLEAGVGAPLGGRLRQFAQNDQLR